MSETILLTGATGFLGMELLARLIEQDASDIVCLVRAPSAEAAAERLEVVLARLYDERPAAAARVSAVAGDVAVDGLGLAPADRAALLERVTSVIHCAASISFTCRSRRRARSTPAARVRMLELSRELAERGQLRRHVHVSTAYVAGRHRGRFLETELDVGQGFRNTYEQSKFDAERALGERSGTCRS